MLKIILHAPNVIMPFCEPARELRLQNAPLWLWQRNLLAPYVTREMELKKGTPMPPVHEPTLVYRDNLFFDEPYIRTFLAEAKKRRRAVRAAFSAESSWETRAISVRMSSPRVGPAPGHRTAPTSQSS